MSEINRVSIITGGSRGIGAAIAAELAGPGEVLVLTHYDKDEEAAKATQAKLEAMGAQVAVYWFDISDHAKTAEVFTEVAEKYGRIDVLVNNAGITQDALLVRMSEAQWDAVLAVNLKSVFNATQAAAKVMMKQRSGRIVSIASVVGAMGNVGQSNYVASKAGIIGMTKTFGRELAARGITANAVAPGFINTEMTEAMSQKAIDRMLSMIPMSRPGEPQDVADAVAFLVSDKAAYITGQVIHVNGGMYM